MASDDAQRRRPRRALRAFLWLLALLVALGLAGAWYVRQQLAPPQAGPSPGEFEVMPGWGASRVAAELKAQGFVRDARIFGLLLRYEGLERSLGEGLYDLDRSMSAPQVSEVLARGGRPRTVFVVIPEGFRLQDVAVRLAAAGFGEADALLGLMREPGPLAPDYLPQDATLEGFLFPARYEVPVRFSAPEVLALMTARFETERERFAAQVEESGLSALEWVTFASLIQAEAADSSEMPIIAGVFWNRLDRGMLLQSDPTAAYGLGKDLPELSALAGDLRAEHPWNTYTRPGLPVGPINNPGSDALAAVFAPLRQNEAGQDYLYFLHGFDGEQAVFRPNLNLQDHERDIERYLR